MNLGRPDVRGPGGGGARVDDLLRGRLEARDGRRAGDLDIVPRSRHEVIIAAAVGDEGIRSARVTDGVRPCRRETHHRRQTQESPE